MTAPRVITIVPAMPGDAALLAEIHAASFAAPWTAEDFAGFLCQPGVAGWIGGAHMPAGFILVRKAAEEAEVLTLAVRPAQRRHGLARAVLDHALEELRLRGTASCFLEVAIDNVAARALYEGAGFAAVARRKGYYETAGARTDATVMRRDL